MHFDTRLFAVAACTVGFLGNSLSEFGMGIYCVVNYITAEKRMKVS